MLTTKQPRIGEYVVLPIDEPEDDPKNENFHPDEQIILLRASYRLDGQQEPILIDRNKRIIGGHGLRKAMKLEGATHIECKYSDLKGARRAAYRIRANALARLSHFAPELLEANVKQIAAQMGKKFSPELLALDASEIEHILHRKKWQSNRNIDPSMLADYDPDNETFLLKVEGIKAADKESILAKVNKALARTGYEAQVY